MMIWKSLDQYEEKKEALAKNLPTRSPGDCSQDGASARQVGAMLCIPSRQ